MSDSDTIINHIKQYEGFVPTVYRCPAGKWTLGYGFNVEDVPISIHVADIWLQDLILDCIGDLVNLFPRFGEFSTKRKIALIDMVYNLGITRFKGFKRMISAVLCEDWNEAAKEALNSKWARDVGQRAITDAGFLRIG